MTAFPPSLDRRHKPNQLLVHLVPHLPSFTRLCVDRFPSLLRIPDFERCLASFTRRTSLINQRAEQQAVEIGVVEDGGVGVSFVSGRTGAGDLCAGNVAREVGGEGVGDRFREGARGGAGECFGGRGHGGCFL